MNIKITLSDGELCEAITQWLYEVKSISVEDILECNLQNDGGMEIVAEQ